MVRTSFSFIDDERTRRVNHKQGPPALDVSLRMEGAEVRVELEALDRRKSIFLRHDADVSVAVEIHDGDTLLDELHVPPEGMVVPVDENADLLIVPGGSELSASGTMRVVEL